MLNIFALEDDPRRIIWLDRFFFQKHGIDWMCVQTGEREYEFRPPYDIILLDHDLGGRQMVAHEDDGVAFLRAVKDRINVDALVVIHSHNAEGALRMQAEWPHAVLAEFGSMKFETILSSCMPRTWPDGTARR